MAPTRKSRRPATVAPRAWQRMLSGRRLDLLDPSPLDVEIEDIARGLSRVARWNGQTAGEWAFSVAQHCLLVEEIVGRLRPGAPAPWRLAALLHDAAEYVIGDLIAPFKAAVGLDYRDFEGRLLRAVHMRFGLPAELPAAAVKLVKRADRVAAYFEATQIAGFGVRDGRKYFGRPGRIGGIALAPWPPETAKARYLERFGALVSDAGKTAD